MTIPEHNNNMSSNKVAFASDHTNRCVSTGSNDQNIVAISTQITMDNVDDEIDVGELYKIDQAVDAHNHNKSNQQRASVSPQYACGGTQFNDDDLAAIDLDIATYHRPSLECVGTQFNADDLASIDCDVASYRQSLVTTQMDDRDLAGIDLAVVMHQSSRKNRNRYCLNDNAPSNSITSTNTITTETNNEHTTNDAFNPSQLLFSDNNKPSARPLKRNEWYHPPTYRDLVNKYNITQLSVSELPNDEYIAVLAHDPNLFHPMCEIHEDEYKSREKRQKRIYESTYLMKGQGYNFCKNFNPSSQEQRSCIANDEVLQTDMNIEKERSNMCPICDDFPCQNIEVYTCNKRKNDKNLQDRLCEQHKAKSICEFEQHDKVIYQKLGKTTCLMSYENTTTHKIITLSAFVFQKIRYQVDCKDWENSMKWKQFSSKFENIDT
jgi:hypothetical protein